MPFFISIRALIEGCTGSKSISFDLRMIYGPTNASSSDDFLHSQASYALDDWCIRYLLSACSHRFFHYMNNALSCLRAESSVPLDLSHCHFIGWLQLVQFLIYSFCATHSATNLIMAVVITLQIFDCYHIRLLRRNIEIQA